MRKKFIAKFFWMLAVILFALGSCKQKDDEGTGHDDPYALTIDSNLAVLLKPTNQEIVSRVPTLSAESGAHLFTVEIPGRINFDSRNQISLASRISGRIERLYVKYNYQPVKKGELIMEIYSPDLAAAQREILMISSSEGSSELLERAKQRLLLLGMSVTQIDKLIRTKEVSYRIPVYSNDSGYLIEKIAVNASSNNMDDSEVLMDSPMMIREGQYVNIGQSLFTIYKAGGLLAEFSVSPSLAPYVKAGNSILMQSKDVEEVLKGEIELIEPVLKNGERFSLARVYVSDTIFRPGQLVKANVPVFIEEGWWVPTEAVWQSGIDAIVFKKENGVFVPKNVKAGVIVDGKVQLLEDISNWEIASNAYFLVDNESFIRPQNTKK